LITNLKTRLSGLEKNNLYVHAAVLTPKYGFKWLGWEERENFDKNGLLRAVENYLLKHPLKSSSQSTASVTTQADSVSSRPVKSLRIMDFLNNDDDYLSAMSNRRSISKQIDDYLETIRKLSDDNKETRLFWLKYEKEWPELAAYTKSILTVPASSAAVERVFSVGGAILRPSRRRLSDKLFEMLMFLKCNWHLFKNDVKL
jgi:hypothetical protein